ncbi:hypothetical protein AMTR_s00092p00108210 [Amborella trichopoda]|uniref:Uncharacterized protein n=1 Tax=Amborella trichopoda TaxID=13333 RepID=W1NV80_AMBTC|nr:hypothetical protein AMTR_s00092p00108210 [Amborella trichopoda]
MFCALHGPISLGAKHGYGPPVPSGQNLVVSLMPFRTSASQLHSLPSGQNPQLAHTILTTPLCQLTHAIKLIPRIQLTNKA